MDNRLWTYVGVAFLLGVVVMYFAGSGAVVGVGAGKHAGQGFVQDVQDKRMGDDLVSESTLKAMQTYGCEDCDFDFDREVGLSDFNIFTKNYHTYGECYFPSWCNGTDINEDSDVDLTDFGIFAAHYGENCDEVI
jgi:hypothetical protein